MTMMIKVSLLVTVTGLAATSVEGFVQQASYCQQKSLSLNGVTPVTHEYGLPDKWSAPKGFSIMDDALVTSNPPVTACGSKKEGAAPDDVVLPDVVDEASVLEEGPPLPEVDTHIDQDDITGEFVNPTSPYTFLRKKATQGFTVYDEELPINPSKSSPTASAPPKAKLDTTSRTTPPLAVRTDTTTVADVHAKNPAVVEQDSITGEFVHKTSPYTFLRKKRTQGFSILDDTLPVNKNKIQPPLEAIMEDPAVKMQEQQQQLQQQKEIPEPSAVVEPPKPPVAEKRVEQDSITGEFVDETSPYTFLRKKRTQGFSVLDDTLQG